MSKVEGRIDIDFDESSDSEEEIEERQPRDENLKPVSAMFNQDDEEEAVEYFGDKRQANPAQPAKQAQQHQPISNIASLIKEPTNAHYENTESAGELFV